MIKARVIVRRMALQILNAEDAVRVMGAAVATEVAARLDRGMGAEGAIPAPKDGGKPMERTGQLAASIGVAVSTTRAGKLRAVVRATGERSDADAKRASARRSTARARATLAVALTLGELGGHLDPRMLRKTPTRSGQRYKLGGTTRRSGTTNAAVAAILSQPPRDLRSRNGHRGVYRVFVGTEAYARIAALAGQGVIRPGLTVKTGGETIRSIG